MKMNELKLVYFSPTGNTRKIIMETARSIDLKSVSFDFSVYKDKKPTLKFRRDDFALFAVPVYGGRVPATFMEYMASVSGDRTPAALIVTYGCREYEDALLELKETAESHGFCVIGAAAFPAEHSIVTTIGSRRPNKADLKEAREFGTELNRRIKKEENMDQISITVPGNTPYRKYMKNVLFPKADKNMCTLCGSCAKVCPVNAIPVKEPYKTITKKCIGCMKCMRVCRQKARSVNGLKMMIAEKKLKKACNSNKEPEIFL